MFNNRYCKAIEEDFPANAENVGVGTGEGPLDPGPLRDINLASTLGTDEPRGFRFDLPFGPRTVIDLHGTQWDWVLSTWNPAFTVDPPPDPFFLIYRGITQFRGLMPLAYPLVPAPGPDINFYVEVVHYYAPRSFDPGANVATVHFIARSTVAADGIPDRDPPMPEGPIGGPTAEIETGNLYWFWNAAQVGDPGGVAASVEAIAPAGVPLVPAGQHLAVNTAGGGVSITAHPALPGSLGGMSFERWMLFWPPGSPRHGTQGLVIMPAGTNVAHVPANASVALVAVYSDLTPTAVAPSLPFPDLGRGGPRAGLDR